MKIKYSNLDSISRDFNIAAMMLSAPVLTFCCCFFIFIRKITFRTYIMGFVAFSYLFYHFDINKVFIFK